MGKLHVSLAHQLMENLEHIVRDFRESQREKRKKVKICCFCEYIDTVMKAQIPCQMQWKDFKIHVRLLQTSFSFEYPLISLKDWQLCCWWKLVCLDLNNIPISFKNLNLMLLSELTFVVWCLLKRLLNEHLINCHIKLPTEFNDKVSVL